MSMDAFSPDASWPRPHDPHTAGISSAEQLQYAREIIRIEASALASLANRVDDSFCRAVGFLFRCKANVIVTGMGKAGLIGNKIAATLASTGTRSHYLHPAEAVHGDLGRIHADDVVLVLSQSGETEEVTRLLPSLDALGVVVIAITGARDSALARAASVVLELGPAKEACSLGLAPSTSTTLMLALGDSLALVTSRMRSFGAEDFAKFHPAGSLGRQLSIVDDHMRPAAECRLANDTATVREVLSLGSKGRRSGAVMLMNGEGKLAGLFTDSDLARLFESRNDAAIDGPIQGVMTASPVTVPAGSMVQDAVEIMAERKISELPVVEDGRPCGLLDITDLVAAKFASGELAEKLNQESTVLPFAASESNSVVPPPKLLKYRKRRRSTDDTQS